MDILPLGKRLPGNDLLFSGAQSERKFSMGQRLEDDTIITGEPCSGCEEVLWGIGKTPKFVYARFSQLERCPGIDWTLYPVPPNNRVFKLEQREDHPCWWRYRLDLGWEINWQICYDLPPYSKLFMGHAPGGTYFQSITPAEHKCVGSFANQNVCNGLFFAHGGFGWIEWKQIAINLAKDLDITLGHHLFYEVFQIDIETVVYKFTDTTRGINVKSKLFRP